MTKFYDRLKRELKGKIPFEKLNLLPHSCQMVGKVLLVKLLGVGLYQYRKKIGKGILKVFPYIKSVVLIREVIGNKRLPFTELIAGDKNTKTVHVENGIKYCIDPMKIMFSKGNTHEKLLWEKKIKKSDIVVDMFAGIGYWSLVAGKHAKRVYSIEINPESVKFLEINCFLNKVSLEILEGDCRKFSKLLKNSADKVMMGYFGTKKFFSYGLEIVKSGGGIFYHDLVENKDLDELKNELVSIAETQNMVLRFISIRKVKSYRPGTSHYVFYIGVKK
jgi:tRNA wybutosine-synthesizing protein 2